MTIPHKYTRVAIALHWVIALGIFVNVLIVWTVDHLPETWSRPMIDTHKSIGITVLAMAVMRLLWRATHRPPPLPAHYASWETRTAHLAHGLLYALIFALPLTGWLHDSAWKDAATHPMKLFGLVPWPRIAAITDLEAARKEQMHDLFGTAHAVCGYVLYVLFVMHVGGALKHQFIDREDELQRMLP